MQENPDKLNPAIPVMEYSSLPGRNRAASMALLVGLAGFALPIVGGVFAILLARRGRREAAANPLLGGRGKAGAAMALGIVSIALWIVFLSTLPSAYLRARRQARFVQCAMNLRQIGQATMMYAAANRGTVPASLDDLVIAKMIPPALFICPEAAQNPAAPAASSGAYGSYSYVYLGAGQKLTSVRSPSMTPLVFEPAGNHTNGGINVLYFDGHVEMLKGAPAAAVLALTPPKTQLSTAPTTIPGQ
jgi:prepilin-type processing-associated H-X9-DG protein